MKKNILVFLGVMLIAAPWIDFSGLVGGLSGSKSSSYKRNLRPNPEFSFWERQMCFGHRKSTNCPDRPLHPTQETRKQNGWDVRKGKTPRRVVTMNINDIPGSSFR